MSTKEKWLEVAKKDLTEESGEGEWNEWDVNHPDFEEWLEEAGIDLSQPFIDKKEASLLEKLVKIANILDEKGLSEEADLIDTIIKEETAKS